MGENENFELVRRVWCKREQYITYIHSTLKLEHYFKIFFLTMTYPDL